MELYTYSIFREMSTKIPAGEYKKLEEDILRNGCRRPISIWGDVIVDGHKRYAICKKHDIPYTTVPKNFDSYAEAKRWARRNMEQNRQIHSIHGVQNDEDCDTGARIYINSEPMLELPPLPEAGPKEVLEINHLTAQDVRQFISFLGERFGVNCLKELIFLLMARIAQNQDDDAIRRLLQQLYNLHYTPTFAEK